ncbi:ECF transporter S component [Brevibacterium samyangense]|uniref:ECF transporter S component n=1 Tax=Brevibacterium samyangense TaxID=366888 RepID=A0ABN2TIK3_9MICO
MNTVPSTRPATGSGSARSRFSWRVVDIVVASVLAVAVGVVFWAWSASWSFLSLGFAAFPPAAGLLTGVWVLAGPLGALVIRKPGAALYCEVLAATVSAVLGTQWGLQVLVSGAVQGLGAELVFLLLAYKRFGLPAALLSGLGAGLFLAVSENLMYNALWAPSWQLVYAVCAAISGVVLAGLVSWLAVGAIARTGALSAFAAGRTAARV